MKEIAALIRQAKKAEKAAEQQKLMAAKSESKAAALEAKIAILTEELNRTLAKTGAEIRMQREANSEAERLLQIARILHGKTVEGASEDKLAAWEQFLSSVEG